jgi:hypothetical protein
MAPGLPFLHQSAVTDPAKIRLALDRILARSEFDSLRPDWLGMRINRILAAIAEWKPVKMLFQLLNGIGAMLERLMQNPMAQWAVFSLSLLFLFLLIAYVAFSIKKRLNLRLPPNSPGGTAGQAGPAGEEALAARFSGTGNFTGAMRRLYVSLMLFLDARRVLSFSPFRTNREIQDILDGRGSPAFSRSFARMSGIFEDKIYALNCCSRDEYEEFVRCYRECRKEAGSFE